VTQRPDAGPTGPGGSARPASAPRDVPGPGGTDERVRGLRVAYVLGTSGGGTGAHVAMLAEACAAQVAAVTVYGPTATGRRFFRRGPAAFVPVEIADRPRPARDAAAVLRLRRLLAQARPDVVHAHGLRAGALAALALARPGPAPALLVTVHNAPAAGRAAGLAYGVLERIVARRADAVTCVSGDLAARMRRRGAHDGGRALVPAPAAGTPSGADIAAARAGLGGAGRPVVLAAGRLAAQKGFTVLLDAAARWRHRDPVPLVAIAGEGPLAGTLRTRARAAGLDAAFLGQRGDVPALLAAADVVVVPSEWEGQPLVVQEALRAGRPIVASRVGGIPDLTGEDGALLIRPGDPGELAAAVLAVLDDPGLAAGLAAAARSRAGALPTPAAAVASALDSYRRLAARPAPGAVPARRRPARGRKRR
jgi:glycosyltransferase involved in cell wall biosynthesis